MTPEQDAQQSDRLTTLRSFVVKVGKWILYALGLCVAIGALAALYVFFQNQLDLRYQTTANCKKHSGSKQICTYADGSLSLRQVERGKKRLTESTVHLDEEDGKIKYVYKAYWFEQCQSGSEITLDKKYSSGESMRLLCSDNALYLGFETEFKTEVTFDELGFYVDHNYEYTDYGPLERYVALANAELREDRLQREKDAAEQKRQAERLAREEREARARELERKRSEAERLAREDALEKKRLEAERLANMGIISRAQFSLIQKGVSRETLFKTLGRTAFEYSLDQQPDRTALVYCSGPPLRYHTVFLEKNWVVRKVSSSTGIGSCAKDTYRYVNWALAREYWSSSPDT